MEIGLLLVVYTMGMATAFMKEDKLWEFAQMLGVSDRFRRLHRIITLSIASVGFILGLLGLAFFGCQSMGGC